MPRTRLDRELQKLRKDLEEMGGLVQKSLRDAMSALRNRDTELALKIIKLDEEETNILYMEIEERCIQTIALHQPVAGDLRFISTTMNVASGLERIGDYAKDVAVIIPFIVDEENLDAEEGILQEMGGITEEMARDAIDAFINKNRGKVDEVRIKEEKINSLYGSIFPKLNESVGKDCKKAHLALNLLLIARYLERIGDHSVNIVNRTMYTIKGKGKYL